jgi:ABC-type glycerol-3-phosphate transport system substrate-binding protein
MNFSTLSKFQIFFLGTLIVAIVAAIGVFALSKANDSAGISNITIWGTLPGATMQTFLQRPEMVSVFKTKKLIVAYVSKPSETFDQEVVEAMASGKGPDAVLISQDATLQYLDKIVQIPYASFPERTFKDPQTGYVQEAELFLTTQGVAALPFAIDPMVMYWNRTLFTNAGISTPPTLWSQLYATDGVISKINKIDVNHNILKTALALGTYSNISHAKDILSLLMLQAGSPIVGRDSRGVLQSALFGFGSSLNTVQNGAEAALSFYTQFADPAKNIYSWNTALPLSRDAFTAGDLALYFGYASELNSLYTRNPNLNFDVALMPQSQSSSANTTFGKIYGLAILKSSPNVTATANAIVTLTTSASQVIWSGVSGYPPVKRDLLAIKPTGPFMSVFYTAALQSQGWLDPNRSATETIFSDMIGSVLSGSKQPAEAVQGGSDHLGQLLNTFSN